MKSVVRIEISWCKINRTLIPRSGYGRILKSGSPELNRQEMTKLLKYARSLKYSHSEKLRSVQTDCYGHLLGLFGREVVERMHVELNTERTGMRVDPLNCIAISCFRDLFKTQSIPLIKPHYDTQFGRIQKKHFASIPRRRA